LTDARGGVVSREEQQLRKRDWSTTGVGPLWRACGGRGWWAGGEARRAKADGDDGRGPGVVLARVVTVSLP